MDYHVAMYAVDDAGNRGDLSNIVAIRVPAPPTSPPTEGPSSTGAFAHKDVLFNKWAVGGHAAIRLSPLSRAETVLEGNENKTPYCHSVIFAKCAE